GVAPRLACAPALRRGPPCASGPLRSRRRARPGRTAGGVRPPAHLGPSPRAGLEHRSPRMGRPRSTFLPLVGAVARAPLALEHEPPGAPLLAARRPLSPSPRGAA